MSSVSLADQVRALEERVAHLEQVLVEHGVQHHDCEVCKGHLAVLGGGGGEVKEEELLDRMAHARQLVGGEQFEEALAELAEVESGYLAAGLAVPVKLWHNRGRALAALGRNDEAMEAFEAMVKSEPWGTAGYRLKAKLLWAMERFEEAVQVMRKALSVCPSESGTYPKIVKDLEKMETRRKRKRGVEVGQEEEEAEEDEHAPEASPDMGKEVGKATMTKKGGIPFISEFGVRELVGPEVAREARRLVEAKAVRRIGFAGNELTGELKVGRKHVKVKVRFDGSAVGEWECGECVGRSVGGATASGGGERIRKRRGGGKSTLSLLLNGEEEVEDDDDDDVDGDETMSPAWEAAEEEQEVGAVACVHVAAVLLKWGEKQARKGRDKKRAKREKVMLWTHPERNVDAALARVGLESEAVPERLRELERELGRWPVKRLQAKLRENKQRTSGRKEVLVDRVVEGMLFGAPPTCPRCQQRGVLFVGGAYRCDGHSMGRRCTWVAGWNEVRRREWV